MGGVVIEVFFLRRKLQPCEVEPNESSLYKRGPCYVTDSVCNVANEEHPRVAGERKNCWNLADTRLISIELLHTESVR